MTERELQAAVVELAGLLGWRAYHPWLSVRSARGYPDLTLLSPTRRRVIWAELKGPRGRPSPAQRAWLADLRAAGCEAYLWTVADYPDAIAAILAAKERP